MAARHGRRLLIGSRETPVRRFLRRHERGLGVACFGYALLLPTNVLFIAGGIVGAPLGRMLLGFWAARAIVDTALVWAADEVSGERLTEAATDPLAIAAQLAGLALVVLVLRAPWGHWRAQLLSRARRSRSA